MEEETVLIGTTITLYNILVVTDYALGLFTTILHLQAIQELDIIKGCFIVNSKLDMYSSTTTEL